MTTENTTHVWQQLNNNASIRTDHDTIFNFYWIKDTAGLYGFHIKFTEAIPSKEIIEKLKGFTIVKGGKDGQITDFVLWLKNNSDWQLFNSLCNDIAAISVRCNAEVELLHTVNARLKKWQQFLSDDNLFVMSEIRQMGLFAELQCLKDFIIPNFGSEQGVLSWSGPNYDKQDFSLPVVSIEVKAFTVSKGPFVQISSAHQLLCANRLLLIAFGIVRSDSGNSIKDLVEEIKTILTSEKCDNDLFEEKLAKYGYIPGVTQEPFLRFHCTKILIYEVRADFPKIVPANLPSEIVSVGYTIDLAKCDDFSADFMSLIK